MKKFSFLLNDAEQEIFCWIIFRLFVLIVVIEIVTFR